MKLSIGLVVLVLASITVLATADKQQANERVTEKLSGLLRNRAQAMSSSRLMSSSLTAKQSAEGWFDDTGRKGGAMFEKFGKKMAETSTKQFKRVGKTAMGIWGKLMKQAKKIPEDFMRELYEITDKIYKKLKKAVDDALYFLEKYANEFAEWFKDIFNICDINDSDMKELFTDALDFVSPPDLKEMGKLANKIVSGKDKNQDRKVSSAACTGVWDIVEMLAPHIFVAVSILTKLIDKCKLMKGTKHPTVAFSLGLGPNGRVDGLNKFGSNVYVGFGMDLKGNKFCTVGGCYGFSASFPPDFGGSVAVGASATVSMNPPGRGWAGYLNFGLDLNYMGVDGGLTYWLPPFTMMEFTAISVSTTLDSVSGSIFSWPVSVSFGAGKCYVARCIMDKDSAGSNKFCEDFY